MRKLASIQKVAEIRPIEGADRIVAYRINDWWVVDGKDKFNVGDLVVYFEVDSLLPEIETFEFLASRGSVKNSELEDGTIVQGYRLRTIKLKGQYSQGLIMPWKTFYTELLGYNNVYEGMEVTSILDVHKYEKPMNAQLRGQARGNFPSFLRKSDQERCQNIRKDIWQAYEAGDEFEVSVKLDGSSMTVYSIRNSPDTTEFGVCSRNIDLKDTDDNLFWQVARRERLEEKLLAQHAFQGELVAPNIQGNFEGVTRPEFYVYSIFDIREQCYISPLAARIACSSISLNYVPILHPNVSLRELFPDATQDTIIPLLLEYADGPSGLNGKYREGLVFKRVDGKFSFKAISNRYLAKEKD